jgi:hypothetical protein
VNSKQKKTIELVFKNPIQANILWSDIESLFIALGAKISEGSGSRVRVKLSGIRAVFHRPHPQKTTDKGAVNSVRRFLENAGVYNDGV